MTLIDAIADVDLITQAALIGIVAAAALWVVGLSLVDATRRRPLVGRAGNTIARHRYGWRAELAALARGR